uniref:Uncharacterized protein n=1 Tax=Brassica oleracea var. oleracea TaxID=109376 RepID=A0A0D3CH18_BRAOL
MKALMRTEQKKNRVGTLTIGPSIKVWEPYNVFDSPMFLFESGSSYIYGCFSLVLCILVYILLYEVETQESSIVHWFMCSCNRLTFRVRIQDGATFFSFCL